MSRELKKSKIKSVIAAGEIAIAEREFKEASFSVRWPTELNEFLEEFVGNLFYIESPPVEIVGGIDFVIDMYMPQRVTTAIIATKNLLSALIYYIKNDIGPIPDDWVQRDGRFLIPTPDLIRFRLKTFNPHMSPAKGQVGTWSPKSGPATSMNGEDCTSLSTAVGIFEEPGICFFLYGGTSDPNLTDLSTSYSYLSRILGRAENKEKSESPQAFLKALRRRFPNYAGVLIEMGWAPKEIPLTPDKLPVKMYDMYKRAELIAHQDLKERVYKISKMTGNVAQMVAILRSLDEDIILKKENVKSERASRDLGLKGGNPDWL